ncbi:MAG: hypothetical protein ALECFALPRED_006159 [Alectoria fallacina]|uniref:Cytochrome P450 n=1 Tax=Alectoria fallacina TaxID=1903189 RepID=A0A8H3IVZ1_9LECA|nr:MAG: hypothetical protein ALECFALPRED_006159 [Alectoria fallacina]
MTRVSILNDEALKQITIRQPYRWQKTASQRKILFPFLGDGILLAEGDDHAQQRKALAPAFSISSIKALSPIFWRKALLLSKLWRAELGKVQNSIEVPSIEVLHWLNSTTLDIIGEAGFGVKLNTLNHPQSPMKLAYERFFRFENWDRLYHGLAGQTSLTKYLPMRTKHENVAAAQTVVNMASEIIRDKQSEKHSKALSSEKDILALMMRENSMGTGKPMTFQVMRDNLLTFLGAGHDTTAAGVAWTLHLLAKHSSTQEKLRKEIQHYMPFLFSHDREDEARFLEIDEDRLPYLNNVCRESLRYIPPVPLAVRQSFADEHLCGYRIPAGTMVCMFANTINRAPEFWGNTANIFDPDRWDHLPDTYKANAYMTFLHGPRGCIGKKFAETEMKTLLCCLLSMYRFDIDDSVDDPENSKMWRITLRPKDGITLKVSLLE